MIEKQQQYSHILHVQNTVLRGFSWCQASTIFPKSTASMSGPSMLTIISALRTADFMRARFSVLILFIVLNPLSQSEIHTIIVNYSEIISIESLWFEYKEIFKQNKNIIRLLLCSWQPSQVPTSCRCREEQANSCQLVELVVAVTQMDGHPLHCLFSLLLCAL